MCGFIGRWAACIGTAAMAVTLSLHIAPARAQTTLRVGHFPNVTHVQALIAHNMTRQGKGWFEQRLGPGIKIEWYVYNAGPSAMEAVFAKSIDLTYVGPNPAINAYFKSNAQEGRILAGAVNGGSALVVQGDFDSENAGGLPRQEDRHAAVRQYAGCRGARLAGQRRAYNHANGRRRAGCADGQSRSTVAVQAEAARRRLDGRALGVAA